MGWNWSLEQRTQLQYPSLKKQKGWQPMKWWAASSSACCAGRSLSWGVAISREPQSKTWAFGADLLFEVLQGTFQEWPEPQAYSHSPLRKLLTNLKQLHKSPKIQRPVEVSLASGWQGTERVPLNIHKPVNLCPTVWRTEFHPSGVKARKRENPHHTRKPLQDTDALFGFE